MSNFQAAISGAFKTLKSETGVAVTYARGIETISLTAVPGRTSFQQVSGDGTTVTARVKDWIITTSELVLSESAVTPARNDTITEVIGDKRYAWEVMPLLGEEWRYADHSQTAIRVHCKLKKTENV